MVKLPALTFNGYDNINEGTHLHRLTFAALGSAAAPVPIGQSKVEFDITLVHSPGLGVGTNISRVGDEVSVHGERRVA